MEITDNLEKYFFFSARQLGCEPTAELTNPLKTEMEDAKKWMESTGWVQPPDLILRVVFSVTACFIQKGRPDQGLSNSVGVTVGCWTAIFEVAEAFLSNLAWDTNTGTTVGHTS